MPDPDDEEREARTHVELRAAGWPRCMACGQRFDGPADPGRSAEGGA